MASTPTIRATSPADLDGLKSLIDGFVAQRMLLRRPDAELGMLLKTGYGAFADDTLVGFCSVEVYSRKLAEIQSLAVHSDYQGLGLGKKLVARCIELARTRDVMEVLAVSSSEQFFHDCGFDYSLPDQKKAFFCQLRPRE